MKNKLLLMLTIMLVVIMSGCSNIKDANKSNFKKSAQQYLDTTYPDYYINVKFPFQSDELAGSFMPTYLYILIKYDIVKATEISEIQNTGTFFSKERGKNLFLYELTSKGEEFYKENLTKDFFGESVSGFCFGKASVNEVISFTEPAEYKGKMISSVTYTYRVSDLPEFAKDPELFTLIPGLEDDVLSEKKPIKRTHDFILTDKGWVHESLLKK